MRYLGFHVSFPDPPTDAWHMIRMAVVEALAVLAMPHLRRSWAQAAKRAAEQPFAIFLPQFLANRLQGVRRSPTPPADALKALLQALGIARALNAAQKVTDVHAEAVLQEEGESWYPVLVRAVMFNFFVSIDPARSDEAGWMAINATDSLLLAAVEASQLPTLLSAENNCKVALPERPLPLSSETETLSWQERMLIERLTAWGARLIAVRALRNSGEFSFSLKPGEADFSVFHAAAVRGARRAISLLEAAPATIPALAASRDITSTQPQTEDPNSLEHSPQTLNLFLPTNGCSSHEGHISALCSNNAPVAVVDDDDGIEAEHKRDQRLAGVIARFLRRCVFRASLRRLLRIARMQTFPFATTGPIAGDSDYSASTGHANEALGVGMAVDRGDPAESQQLGGGTCPNASVMPWTGLGFSSTVGCWAADPFGRFRRYSMYEERIEASSVIGLPRRELWNLDFGRPVIDDSADPYLYCQTVAALSRFANLYRQHVLPVLTGLDHAQLRLQALVGFYQWGFAGGFLGFLPSPENVVALDSCLAQVAPSFYLSFQIFCVAQHENMGGS